MTQYEKMARRVVEDGVRAMINEMVAKELSPGDFNTAYLNSYTNVIMLGLKELLKKDAVKVFEPEELAEKLS